MSLKIPVWQVVIEKSGGNKVHHKYTRTEMYKYAMEHKAERPDLNPSDIVGWVAQRVVTEDGGVTMPILKRFLIEEKEELEKIA